MLSRDSVLPDGLIAREAAFRGVYTGLGDVIFLAGSIFSSPCGEFDVEVWSRSLRV